MCSDTQVGKRRVAKEDVAEISSLDLAFPATTDAAKLAAGVVDPAPGKMTVVFATYQSIQVVSDAQLKHGCRASRPGPLPVMLSSAFTTCVQSKIG